MLHTHNHKPTFAPHSVYSGEVYILLRNSILLFIVTIQVIYSKILFNIPEGYLTKFNQEFKIPFFR